MRSDEGLGGNEARALVAAERASFVEFLEASGEHDLTFLDLEWRVRSSHPVRPGAATVNTDWLSTQSPDQRDELERVLVAVVATGTAKRLDSQHTNSDGTISYYTRYFGCVRGGGEAVGVLVVTTDLTGQRATESRLLECDRAAMFSSLAAGVVHELNSPLAAVIANLDFLGEDLKLLEPQTADVSELESAVADARGAADRVQRLVSDLYSCSRRDKDEPTTLDVSRVMESALRLAASQLRTRARVEKDYAPVPSIEASASRLQQVFLHLIVNAVQALPEGNEDTNVIRVSTSTTTKGLVVLSVADTGTGIPPETQRKVFAPYFSTRSGRSDTSVGLWICQQIVQSFGGEISFESSPEKGSVFRVSVPASRALP